MEQEQSVLNDDSWWIENVILRLPAESLDHLMQRATVERLNLIQMMIEIVNGGMDST